MSYFEKTKNLNGTIKILVGIIIALILLVLVAFKMVANIAENKTVNINVPQYLDNGKYVIGTNKSTKNVYEMWGRVWFKQLSNFSYKNIENKIKFIEPFLEKKTLFQSKSELQALAKNVKENFISQEFEIKEYKVKELSNGYVEIEATGTLKRKVGLKQDSLSGIAFGYSIVAYTRNGQVIIKNLTSFVDKTNDTKTRKMLKDNKYYNFDQFLYGEDQKLKQEQEKKKQKIKESGGLG